MAFNHISAAEAASLIKHGYNIGLSGFTPAGTAKAVTAELAKIAEAEHAKGNPFQVGIFTGASTGESCDGVMSRAKAIRYRAPYTTNPDFRKAVNNGEIAYNDIHLSQMAQELRYGFMGKVDVAIIEACEVTDDGKIYLTAAGGISPTIARLADKIIIELNAAHSKAAMGLHDVYEPLDPPYRREIPIYKPSDRIGTPYIQVDPKKIVGVVDTNWPDEARSFAAGDPLTDKIGQNVADFLVADMKRGIIPPTFLPLQSGVGNIANAVLNALGHSKSIPAFDVYTEVIQNAVIGLIRDGRVKFASGCSLTVTNDCLNEVYRDMDFFRDKLVLRPSEISNSPEIVRRLGIISINTAIEADIYGNVNSTHIGGTKMMNGIGGSGDFTRNAYISIFTCPSVAKEGKISAIVPMVSHEDHSEHDVNIIVTEQGVADLRGKSPKERAQTIIENCVHPDYKQILWDYLKLTDGKAQTPHCIRAALGMHAELAKSGDMRKRSVTLKKRVCRNVKWFSTLRYTLFLCQRVVRIFLTGFGAGAAGYGLLLLIHFRPLDVHVAQGAGGHAVAVAAGRFGQEAHAHAGYLVGAHLLGGGHALLLGDSGVVEPSQAFDFHREAQRHVVGHHRSEVAQHGLHVALGHGGYRRQAFNDTVHGDLSGKDGLRIPQPVHLLLPFFVICHRRCLLCSSRPPPALQGLLAGVRRGAKLTVVVDSVNCRS